MVAGAPCLAGWLPAGCIEGLEVDFEKAFSLWRQLVMCGGYSERQRKQARLSSQASPVHDGGDDAASDASALSDSEGEVAGGCAEDGPREGIDDAGPRDEFGRLLMSVSGEGDLFFVPNL